MAAGSRIWMMLKPGISIVIPVYRAEGALVELHQRLVKVLEPLGRAFEIIMVEDCGGDGSWDVIEGLAAKDPRVRGTQLSRNFGQHNAILCGIRRAQYDIIVTMDDDLQHPPEEVPRLVQKLADGHDVVYGVPEREQHGLFRDLASVITKMAMKRVMSVGIARDVSAFRAFRTELRESFDSFMSPLASIDVLLTWGTTSFASIKVKHEPRGVGESGYTFTKLVTHALNMMTGFSSFPLRLATFVGFLFTLFGICILVYVLGRYVLQGSSVPGFPFLASIIAIFSGGQLFALGIIGEYLGHVHFRTMGKPTYVIRSTTERRPDSGE